MTARLAALLALVGLVLSMGWLIRTQHTDLANKQAALEMVGASLAAQQATSKVTERVVTKYIKAREAISTTNQELAHALPTFVPPGTCELPPGIRVFHDAAATGATPAASGVPDAAPVPAEDLAGTLADNYSACRALAAQLGSLQQWINEVSPPK